MQLLIRHPSHPWYKEEWICFIQLHALCCFASAYTCSVSEGLQDEVLEVDGSIPFQPWTAPVLFKTDWLWPATLFFPSRTRPPVYRWQCCVIWLPGCHILCRTANRGVPFNLRGLNSNSLFGLITLMSWAGLGGKYRGQALWHQPNGALGWRVYSKEVERQLY